MGKSKPSGGAKEMDPVALHRKLEPIYEMIDGGNNKAALKSIDRELLSKFPAMQIGRVLKGIVLQRMGKDDEGLDLCESVRLEGPRDDTVLHTLSLFYKNTGRTEQTTAMFEAAAEAQPRNPEYLRSLFQSYARDRAFVKQQTCAMKLYRLTNDPKHIMWAVCGALLQTRDGSESVDDDDDAKRKRDAALLQLASTMCAKLEAGGAVRDRETCLVYARVLRESGKGEKALELLESPLGERCVRMPAERRRLCAAQASSLGPRFAPRADEHWRAVLESAPDDWEAMSAALDIAMPGTIPAVVRAPSPPAGGAFARRQAHGAAGDAAAAEALSALVAAAGLDPRAADASLEAGRALVAALRAAADAKGGAKAAGRGAYLLSVELAWRETQVRRDAGDASPSLALADAIFEYWRAFGAWTSCARDLRPYAELIAPEAARASLRDALGRAAAEIDLAEEKGEKQNPAERNRATRRAAAAESVRAALGLCGGSWLDASSRSGGIKGLSMPRLVNPAEGRALARTFIAKYRRARRLVPENADPREPVPGDAFAALGAQALAAEAVSWAARGLESGDASGVWDASGDGEVVMSLLACCALSEEALRASPNHAELRLVLVTAYSLLGASTAASDALAPLDVKNIQMDTMAHFVLSCSESGCAPSVLLKYCRLAERLRLDAKRDIAEAGVKAYDNGAFTKALEFVDFHARLCNSHAARKFAAASARVALRETMLKLGDATVEPQTRQSGRFPETLVNVLDEAVQALGPLESDASPTRDADEFAKTFNEDATLNPTFAPPFHGDAGLSACDWWAGPARSPDAGTSEKVPVGGAHDKGMGFGVSVAHRAGWARATRRRVVELHALRLAARAADESSADIFEETKGNVQAVLAAAEALARTGEANEAPGEACARARAPVTAAAARVSDAALRALACLLALRTSGGGGEHLARDAADALDAYADAFASFCDGATAGFRGDASAPRVERAAARGAVPLLFHAVAEAGATATATLRAYACALAAKRCPGFASLEKGARESLAFAAQRASGTVAAAVRAAAAAADATASGEGKEADALADRVDKWMGILAEREDPHDGRELGRALRREVCEDVARRIVAAHRVALNAVKAHADRFAALAEETADALSRA